MLAAITLVINVGINLFFIPRCNAVGSAYASLVAQSFMAAAQIGVAMRIFNIRPDVRYILKIGFFTLLIVGFSLLTPEMAWWVKVLTAMLLALVAAQVLGLISVKEIVTTLRQRD